MKFAAFSVTMLTGAFIVFFNFAWGFERGYKLGQIDALTGTIEYELVVRPDSTREWVRK